MEGIDPGAICEKDVGSSILVVIKNCNSTGHGCRHVPGHGLIRFEDKGNRMVLELNPWSVAGSGSNQQHAAKSGDDVQCHCIGWPRGAIHHFTALRARKLPQSRSA